MPEKKPDSDVKVLKVKESIVVGSVPNTVFRSDNFLILWGGKNCVAIHSLDGEAVVHVPLSNISYIRTV